MSKLTRTLVATTLITLTGVLLSGCSSMSGQGPSASAIRSKNSGYQLIEIQSVSQIPVANNTFASASSPPRHPDRSYLETLTPRDQLQVLITDASSTSSPFYRPGASYTYGPVEVPNSGKIKFPYIGEVDVLNKSLADVSREVSVKVKEVSASAEVTITRPFRLQKRANILGDVRLPGPVEIDRKRFTVLDVLAAAGGTNGQAHNYIYSLMRDNKEYQYDSLALRKKPFLVEDGDLIRVTKNPRRVIFVSGAVNRPGKFEFPNEAPTLADALAYGAGLNEHKSDPEGVFVFRNRGNKVETAYAIDMNKANAAYLASRFPIEGGDTIYVSEAPLTHWNRFIGTVLPFGQAAKMGATATTGIPIP
ncbi:MAG: SLBB domain-containing protein [Verrucomicrobiota bacterium]